MLFLPGAREPAGVFLWRRWRCTRSSRSAVSNTRSSRGRRSWSTGSRCEPGKTFTPEVLMTGGDDVETDRKKLDGRGHRAGGRAPARREDQGVQVQAQAGLQADPRAPLGALADPDRERRAGQEATRPRKKAQPAETLRRRPPMAHKKGLGSSKNGRDSHAQRLGVKVFAGQTVTAGSIIVRQRGTSSTRCRHRRWAATTRCSRRSTGTVEFTRRNGAATSTSWLEPAEPWQQTAGGVLGPRHDRGRGRTRR